MRNIDNAENMLHLTTSYAHFPLTYRRNLE